MTIPLPTRCSMVAAACVLTFGGELVANPSQAVDQADRSSVIRLFHQRVDDYAALHRRLEGPLPPLTTTRDMARNFVLQQTLASAIRRARRDAQQGAIFSPDVAAVFRAIVREAMAGHDIKTFLDDLYSEHEGIETVSPVINEPLPRQATREMPVVLLHALPALPEDLEYRIVYRDLVLWDIHANLVVDYVPDAIGVEATLES